MIATSLSDTPGRLLAMPVRNALRSVAPTLAALMPANVSVASTGMNVAVGDGVRPGAGTGAGARVGDPFDHV